MISNKQAVQTWKRRFCKLRKTILMGPVPFRCWSQHLPEKYLGAAAGRGATSQVIGASKGQSLCSIHRQTGIHSRKVPMVQQQTRCSEIRSALSEKSRGRSCSRSDVA